MAGTSIGPLTLKITANADGMTATIKRADAFLDNWATVTKNKMDRVYKRLTPSHNTQTARGLAKSLMGGVGNVSDGIQKAMGDPGRFLAENIMGGLANAAARIPKFGAFIAPMFDLLGGAMTFAMDSYEKGAASLIALGQAAARVGMPMNDLKAVIIAAGPAGEMMDKAMFKFQKHIMDAARGSEKAKAAFVALGISTKDIGRRNTLDLLKEIADKFEKLPAGAAKSAAAFALFGRAGFAMMPMLGEGRAKIERSQKLVEQFGLGGDDNSLRTIKQAQEAKKTMALFSEGVTNQVAIGMAPILLTLSEHMGKFGTTTKGVSGFVIDAFEAVAVAGAAFWNVIDGIGRFSRTLWYGFKLGCEFAAVAILDFGAYALESLSKVMQKLAEMVITMMRFNPAHAHMMDELKKTGIDIEGIMKGGIGDQAGGALAKKLRDAAARGREMIGKDKTNLLDMWASPTAMDKVRGFFDQVRAKAAAIGGAMGDAMSEALATWGPKIMEIAKQLDGPLYEFRERVREINTIWKTGILGGDPSFAQQAIGMQTQKLMEGMRMPERKFAGAAERDSMEAYSAIIQHQYGDQNKTLQERLLMVAEEQKARAADQVRIGQETLDFLRANPGVIMDL